MRRFFLAMLAVMFLVGCDPAKPQEPAGYLEVSGNFIADLVITDNSTDEVIFEGLGIVRVFQSGGAGTYWGGAVGTAHEDVIIIDTHYTVLIFDVFLVGTATASGAEFDYTIENGEQKASAHYVFTDLRPAPLAQEISGAITPDFAFVPQLPFEF